MQKAGNDRAMLRIGNMQVNRVVREGARSTTTVDYPPKWHQMFERYMRYGDQSADEKLRRGKILYFDKSEQPDAQRDARPDAPSSRAKKIVPARVCEVHYDRVSAEGLDGAAAPTFREAQQMTDKAFAKLRTQLPGATRFPRAVVYSQFSDGVGGLYQYKHFLMRDKGAWAYEPSTVAGGPPTWRGWNARAGRYETRRGNAAPPRGACPS